jgi:Flp pilus assembly protein CpaB
VLVAIAAVVLAGAAAYLSYEYAHKADTRAQKNVQRVDVLVAKSDISKGTSAASALNSGLISTKQVPRGILPPNAVVNASDLTNKVAVATIATGQFIVAESFVQPAQVGGFSAIVPKGHQAMTITVDSTHGVGGFIQPGDLVNVLYTGPVTEQKGGNPPNGAPDPANVTAFLLPSIRVLAVGTTTTNSAPAGSTSSTGLTTSGQAAGASTATSASTSATNNSGLITLDVTPRQAEQIAQGIAQGSFYLTLDAPGVDPSKFTPPAEVVGSWNLFDQRLTVVDELRRAKVAK